MYQPTSCALPPSSKLSVAKHQVSGCDAAQCSCSDRGGGWWLPMLRARRPTRESARCHKTIRWVLRPLLQRVRGPDAQLRFDDACIHQVKFILSILGSSTDTSFRPATPQVRLNFIVRQVTDSAGLRAAADLRAAAFYSYPVDRSVFSARVRPARSPYGAETALQLFVVSPVDAALKCLLATTVMAACEAHSQANVAAESVATRAILRANFEHACRRVPMPASTR